MDANKIFHSTRSAIKFANKLKKEPLAAAKELVPFAAPLIPFVAPIAFPTSLPDAPAPLSSNALGSGESDHPPLMEYLIKWNTKVHISTSNSIF